ncbi:MAG: hypothetical protein K9M98_02105 [Cephaloticoccus sp.]|nr:hypothetical protein [Cephaloticoccus sp.]MCF7759273.1 hypothetical protein [Cephaloticoccus sp.]
MRKLLLIALGCWIILLGTSCTSPTASVAQWAGPEVAGAITEHAINEASGLAASRISDNVFWVNNDSGGQPVLYAIDHTGAYLGSVRIEGATNYDWEDCTSVKIDGTSYLIAADVGDNFAQRAECVLYVIAEPDPATLNPAHEVSAPIAWQIHFKYAGGARDCENVAVDEAEQNIYLLSKRTTPPEIYRLPLGSPGHDATIVVERIGQLNGIPQPTGPSALIEAPWGKYRAFPCSFDIASDQRTAVVLTYGEVYLYTRQANQSWVEALAGQPLQLSAHNLPQAEGVCFTHDNQSVLVATEGVGEPFLRYSRTIQP